jgi:hypothetical protein
MGKTPIDFFQNGSKMKIQSNLCTTTTLGTGKKWSLFKGGRYSEGQTVKFNILINKNLIKKTGRTVITRAARWFY